MARPIFARPISLPFWEDFGRYIYQTKGKTKTKQDNNNGDLSVMRETSHFPMSPYLGDRDADVFHAMCV